MYWKLRTISLKRVLPYCAALLVLAALLTLITSLAPFRLLGGPADIKDVTLDVAEGRFVQADAVKLFDAFAEIGEGEKPKAVDCIIACGDGRVVALCLPARLLERAEAQMQETYSWLVSDGVEPRYGFQVRGELVPLEGDELAAYFTWLERNSDRLALAGAVEGTSYADFAMPYVLRVDMLGGVDLWIAYVVTVLVLTACIGALVLILFACFGLFQLSARLYVRRNQKALKLRSVQNDFEMSEKVGDVHVGQTFTWYFNGPITVCLKNAAVAWSYTVQRGRGGGAVLYLSGGDRHDLRFGSPRKAARFLEALKNSECGAVFGYSQETQEQFKEWLTRRILRKGRAA